MIHDRVPLSVTQSRNNPVTPGNLAILLERVYVVEKPSIAVRNLSLSEYVWYTGGSRPIRLGVL